MDLHRKLNAVGDYIRCNNIELFTFKIWRNQESTALKISLVITSSLLSRFERLPRSKGFCRMEHHIAFAGISNSSLLSLEN
ncbi:hypothetical protein EG68_06764 [Paragonimus skrjabini miyazakii]|uniref:Uncharacterized protein n=1 Tax=Paragonimus skrjabini miyazakii TaxID=59628 RepID=A0A8S9YMY2_9TREM|nr:hypothetical protein EG68_06764 [Paragonimus skrjabini miyazakii]